MNRRTVLRSGGALALGTLLTACRSQPATAFRVEFLDKSLPPQLIKRFRQDLPQTTQADFTGTETLAQLFQKLQHWQLQSPTAPPRWRQWLPFPAAAPAGPAQLVSLGDSWLQAAIQQNLVQPLAIADWSQLPPRWQALVRRDAQGFAAEAGEAALWGAPYCVQSLAMVYRRPLFKRLDWQPATWSDLWRPELRGRIALPAQPRLVIALAQMRLGYSPNDVTSLQDPRLKVALQQLHQQVRVYDSATALKALISEDLWLTLAWSGDLLTALTRYRQLQATLPSSGTLLSADLWVQPRQSLIPQQEQVIQRWIEFCWQRPVATQLSLASDGFSPVLSRGSPPVSLENQPLRLPAVAIQARSHTLDPLPEAAHQAYEQLWQSLFTAA